MWVFLHWTCIDGDVWTAWIFLPGSPLSGHPGFLGVSRHSQWVPALGAGVPDNVKTGHSICDHGLGRLWNPHLRHTEQGVGSGPASSAAKGGREQESVPSQSPPPAWTSRPPEPRGPLGRTLLGTGRPRDHPDSGDASGPVWPVSSLTAFPSLVLLLRGVYLFPSLFETEGKHFSSAQAGHVFLVFSQLSSRWC